MDAVMADAAAPAAAPAAAAGAVVAGDEAGNAAAAGDAAAAAAPALAGAPGSRIWTRTIYLQEIVAAVEKFERYTAAVADAVREYGDRYCYWTNSLHQQLHIILPNRPDLRPEIEAHLTMCTVLLKFKYDLDNDNRVKATTSLLAGFTFGPHTQKLIKSAQQVFPPHAMSPYNVDSRTLKVRQFWMRRASDDVLQAIVQVSRALPIQASGRADWQAFLRDFRTAKVKDVKAMLQERRIEAQPTYNIVSALQQRQSLGATAAVAALMASSASSLKAHRASAIRNHAAHRDAVVRLRDALPNKSREEVIKDLRTIVQHMVEKDMREVSSRAALSSLEIMLQDNPHISRSVVYEELSAVIRAMPRLD